MGNCSSTEKLFQYRFGAQIGHGSFGEVRVAQHIDPETGRPDDTELAVKCMKKLRKRDMWTGKGADGALVEKGSQFSGSSEFRKSGFFGKSVIYGNDPQSLSSAVRSASQNRDRSHSENSGKAGPNGQDIRVRTAIFRNELRVMSHLHHPNVVHLVGSFEDRRRIYAVTPLYGEELFSYIVRRKRLEEVEARVLVKQVLEALNYVHASKIAHRDVKAENFMFQRKNAIPSPYVWDERKKHRNVELEAKARLEMSGKLGVKPEGMATLKSLYKLTLCNGVLPTNTTSEHTPSDHASNSENNTQCSDVPILSPNPKDNVKLVDLEKAEKLFEARPELVLIDFGMSSFIHNDAKLKHVCGSPHYVAPELIRRSYGKKIDVWAAGVLTFLMLNGKYPFDAFDQSELGRLILHGEPSYGTFSQGELVSSCTLNGLGSAHNGQPVDTLSLCMNDLCNHSLRSVPGSTEEGFQLVPPHFSVVRNGIGFRISLECVDFIQRLLLKNPDRRLSSQEALRHPWLMGYTFEQIMKLAAEEEQWEKCDPQTDFESETGFTIKDDHSSSTSISTRRPKVKDVFSCTRPLNYRLSRCGVTAVPIKPPSPTPTNSRTVSMCPK